MGVYRIPVRLGWIAAASSLLALFAAPPPRASVTSSHGGVDAFTCLSVQTGVQEQAPVWAGVGLTPRSPRLTASSKISSLDENVLFFPPPGIRKYP